MMHTMEMKTAVLTSLWLLVGIPSVVVAFVSPSGQPSGSGLQATAELSSLFGVDIETGKKIFDPLGLAQWAPVEFLRKGELSNGRAAMLANVGWFWPKTVGLFDSNDVQTTDPIEAILQADAQWWAQFLFLCGVLEGFKYRAEVYEGKSFTGEGPAAFDWTNQWAKLSDKQKTDIRMKELKNGRLAMLGFASYVSDYFIPGSVPLMPHF